MERFVTVKKQKDFDDYTGHLSEREALKKIINSNGTVCIYGNYGVGKTHLVHHVLKNMQYIELTNDLIKSGILDRISDSTHLLIDDVDVPMPQKTKKALIIISNKMIEELDCIQIHPLTIDELVAIGTKKFPGSSNIQKYAQQSNGNIRNFFYSIENFSFQKDVFKSPKDFLHDLICDDSDVDPMRYADKIIAEHGNSWCIMHDNYVDSPNVVNLDNLANIADCMSLADIKDEEIYSGYLQYQCVFNLFGIIIPSVVINHTLKRSTMRPGSFWTKYNNYKMRTSRYSSLTNRVFKTTVDVEFLNVIAQYCKTKSVNELLPLLNTYGFESADMDMLNHILLVNKIKTRTLQSIKKKLKEDSK